MTYQEIREVMKRHFGEHLTARRAQIDREGRLLPADAEALRNSISAATEAIQTGHPLNMQDDAHLVAGFVEKYKLEITEGTPAYKSVRDEVIRAHKSYCESVLEYDKAQDGYDFEPARPSRTKELGTDTKLYSLRILIDKFVEEKRTAKAWTGSKTESEKLDHFSLLIEVLGDVPDVASLGVPDARRMKETLIAYPVHRNKKPALRHLTLAEAIALEGAPKIHVTTVTKYLQTYTDLFRWAKSNGYIDVSIFDGMIIKQGKSVKSDRDPFTDEQLQMMLTELVHNRRSLITKPWQKYATLLGLYSGARRNEICQLHLTDIRQEDGIWVIDVNDDGDAHSLKTAASKRVIPMHSDLIRLGFLDYANDLRASGETRLFPEFKYCKQNGWGRSLGRWFNNTFLPELDIKHPGLVYHSLRHTVIDRLMRTSVQEPIVKALVGHTAQGVTQQSYFKRGYTLAQLSGAVESLRYPEPSPS